MYDTRSRTHTLRTPSGHTDAIELLVSLGADHRATNLYRETSLHECEASGQPVTALQLIGYGAYTISLNKYNATALSCAAAEGHVLTAFVLLCCGVAPAVSTPMVIIEVCARRRLNSTVSFFHM